MHTKILTEMQRLDKLEADIQAEQDRLDKIVRFHRNKRAARSQIRQARKESIPVKGYADDIMPDNMIEVWPSS